MDVWRRGHRTDRPRRFEALEAAKNAESWRDGTRCHCHRRRLRAREREKGALCTCVQTGVGLAGNVDSVETAWRQRGPREAVRVQYRRTGRGRMGRGEAGGTSAPPAMASASSAA